MWWAVPRLGLWWALVSLTERSRADRAGSPSVWTLVSSRVPSSSQNLEFYFAVRTFLCKKVEAEKGEGAFMCMGPEVSH